jgi:hypothetical protein
MTPRAYPLPPGITVPTEDRDTDFDVSWAPSLMSCKKGESIAFIQIGYDGLRSWKAPFVDDGSMGSSLYAKPTHCPEYPNFGNPGSYQDSPSTPLKIGPVKFVVCQVCTEPCCSGATGGQGRTIARVVKCKTWKNGDHGPIDQLGNFPDATMSQILLWRNTVAAKYPDWMKCYKCTHSNEYGHNPIESRTLR